MAIDNVTLTAAYGTSAGPRVSSVTIPPDQLQNASLSTVQVQFDQPIDLATFTAADISLPTPSVGEINVTGNGRNVVDGDTTPNTDDDTDFGSVVVSGGTETRTFMIQNRGSASLNLIGGTPVTVSGSNFTVMSQPGSSTIATGGSTTFQVKFDPSATGLLTATVNVASDDSDEATYDFAIQGTGTTSGATTIYSANMDTDPVWTLDSGSGSSKWEWGSPAGGGGEHGNADPSTGYTGSNVMGYNLNGDYAIDINSTEWAMTPAIDDSAFSEVGLEFDRWLNVESPTYDHAYIQVSNNGSSWTQVWANTAERRISESYDNH